ncbi:MAG: CrcB family protein [Balneolia bacterium]|nr:CrcB family protein [Balneolia bacterium]
MKAAVPLVALGGAIGAGLRYSLLLINPYGMEYSYVVILVENITGAFFLGLLAGLISRTKIKSWPWAAFLGTGVLGSFTTFSTFITDIIDLSASSLLVTGIYMFVSVIVGLIAALFGFWIGSIKKGQRVK